MYRQAEKPTRVMSLLRGLLVILLITFVWMRIWIGLKTFSGQPHHDTFSFVPSKSDYTRTMTTTTTTTNKTTTSRLRLTPTSCIGQSQSSSFQSSSSSSSSCNLPQWMKEYFVWHRETLKGIHTTEDWLQQRIFVIRCMDDDICGGTADRLRPLPMYLAIAARSKRLLFLRWNRPTKLERIMEPYQMNWVVPDILAPLIDNQNGTSSRSRKLEPMVREAMKPNVWLLEGLSQAMTYGDLYDSVVADFEGESTVLSDRVRPQDYYHDMFLALFRPVPALQIIIDRLMEDLHLHPNQFVSTHIRALYPGHPYEQSRNVTDLQPTVEHAIQCASSRLLGAPVFVAADTTAAKEIAQQYGRTMKMIPVVSDLDIETTTSTSSLPSRQHQDAVHMEFDQRDDPSEFFDIFVDLFIMSQSRCVSVGIGGFGRLGSLTSFNASCRPIYGKQQQQHGRLMDCK